MQSLLSGAIGCDDAVRMVGTVTDRGDSKRPLITPRLPGIARVDVCRLDQGASCSFDVVFSEGGGPTLDEVESAFGEMHSIPPDPEGWDEIERRATRLQHKSLPYAVRVSVVLDDKTKAKVTKIRIFRDKL